MKNYFVKFFKSKFGKFLTIYTLVLLVLSAVVLINLHSLLVEFEKSQPERVVEAQIEMLCNAAKNGEFENVLPMSDSLKEYLGDDKYPASFVNCFKDAELGYVQNAAGYGAGETSFNIVCDGRPLVTVNLEGSNERTEMIVFTCFDWALKSCEPVVFDGEFKLPGSLSVKLYGETLVGEKGDDGNYRYEIRYLGDADVEVFDLFGNSEKQYGKVKQNFPGTSFTVPSNFEVTADGIVLSDIHAKVEMIPEFEYISEYTDMPTLNTYNLRYISRSDGSVPDISIKDNLGNTVEYNYGDKLFVREQEVLPSVPGKLLEEANVMDFARKWSLFMTNDLAGGLSSLSKYLINGSYLYDVAYRWATGIDRTFTSIHRLYNPPFTDEKVYNFVQYSEDSFSCDIYLVKKMRIANGLDVDDELSRKLFFVKYDATNDGISNPTWRVADMLGSSDEIKHKEAGTNE